MDSPYRIFKEDPWKKWIVGDPKDTVYQIIISAVIGLSAFLGFCILRPRWPTLYAARKRQKDEAESLPELPRSLFGWLPVLWQVTEEEILDSAGLDAFVFLAFFKMAIKYLAILLFFALTIIKPVHDAYPDKKKKHDGDTGAEFLTQSSRIYKANGLVDVLKDSEAPGSPDDPDYLWMYLVFAYFFTGLAMYLIIIESRRIIEIRQDYLGSQSTVTDRTIRLSGIPPELQDEKKIKDFIEDLEIGNVERVTLCRDWKELDQAMAQRAEVLRKLEKAMVEQLHRLREQTHFEGHPTTAVASSSSDDEQSRLLEEANGHTRDETSRPTARVRYGKFKLLHKKVDAIDYYEEKLRSLDDVIYALRKKKFPTKPLAFVTMDSVAACQMAVQAVLDSSPLQLIAKTSPSPSDVAWKNTYMPTTQSLLRAWSITGLIVILTVFWSVLLVPIAGILDLDRIHSVWPRLGELLKAYPLAKSLVQTQLPTLIASLLNLAVPYLYSWLSYQQGMISHGDVELSVISKNFFFTFFNFFIVFTVLGTASLSLENFGSEPLRDTALKLAQSLVDIQGFYVNYIILQALGLFPLRLLEFGSVSLYPFSMLTAKTPRDHEQLVQPPTFSYGFYLPQTLLVFLICVVYSVMRASWMILLPGLAYFIIGYFVHKYQLLYAMDHAQHSTGRGWVIIVDRIIIGLLIFQVTITGQLVLRSAFKRSALVAPLVLITIWFFFVYTESYKPLMSHIALRSIRKAEHEDEVENESSRRLSTASRQGPTIDEAREFGLKFINPSLTTPLEPPWITGKRPRSGRSRDVSSDRSEISP